MGLLLVFVGWGGGGGWCGLGTVICVCALSRTYGVCVITSVSLFCANKLQLAEGINAAHASLALPQ